MAATPERQYYLNGKDLWLVFGVALEPGSTNDFLKFPEAKPPVTHDWQDSNGEDADLSRVFYKSKDITMKCFMVAIGEKEFWKKYRAFFAEWTLPNLKRFTISEFRQSFDVYYKSTSDWKRWTRIQVEEGEKIICEFEITVTEQEPKFSNDDVFIVDETGRFLIA